MPIHRISASSDLEEILGILTEEGGLILEGLYSTRLIDSMRDAIILASENFKPVEFGNSDKARVGDWVVAIGNPFGLGLSLIHI